MTEQITQDTQEQSIKKRGRIPTKICLQCNKLFADHETTQQKRVGCKPLKYLKKEDRHMAYYNKNRDAINLKRREKAKKEKENKKLHIDF